MKNVFAVIIFLIFFYPKVINFQAVAAATAYYCLHRLISISISNLCLIEIKCRMMMVLCAMLWKTTHIFLIGGDPNGKAMLISILSHKHTAVIAIQFSVHLFIE